MRAEIDRWLAARDAASLQVAWTALAPSIHTCALDRRYTMHGATQLAGAMLGPEWKFALETAKPVFERDRVVEHVFVDLAWDLTGRHREHWRLNEKRDGGRGVQLSPSAAAPSMAARKAASSRWCGCSTAIVPRAS